MTTSQQFSLKWTNYTNHITNAFDTLRSKEDFCDVTLSCEGRKIRAHKVLLSACSTYFKEIFKENPCQHPVIIFKNVKYDDLLSIVVYMYQGEVNIEQEALPTFLHTAEMLSIQGLTEDDTSDKNIISVPPPPPQQTVVATALSTPTLSSQPNTITIHGQAIKRDATHLTGPKLTISKPISLFGSNATPVDQIVYTTVTQPQAIGTLLHSDGISPKRKRKIITQIEKPSTYVEQNNTIKSTVPAETEEPEEYFKTEVDTDISAEYAEGEEDKTYQTETDGDEMAESGSQDNAEKTDDDFDKPKIATQAELGRLFSSGGTPTPDNKRPGPPAAGQKTESENLKCEVCHHSFASIAAKRRHMTSRHSKIKELIKCKACGKEFKTKWSLSTHASRFHR